MLISVNHLIYFVCFKQQKNHQNADLLRTKLSGYGENKCCVFNIHVIVCFYSWTKLVVILIDLFSGRIPRLSFIQHSLDIGVVEKPPPPPLTGEQYGNTEPKYPEGGHYQSV